MNTNAEPRAATRGQRWSSRSSRLLLAGIVAALAALSLVAQVALAGPPSPTGVPDQIQPDVVSNKVFLIGQGVGVQIYTCNGSVWSSAVPRADLFDDNGKLIIKHFAGPSWQAADGSKVVGTVVDKVTPDLSAIPWVLLSAKTTPGADGDRLVDTSFIQRLHTTGGLQPPAADCNAATAGTVVESPYTAEYVFWKHTAA
jgi:Protein of unknown function (DUF3455)